MRDVLIITDGPADEAKARLRGRLVALRREYPESAALIAALGDDMARRIDAMPSGEAVACHARLDIQCFSRVTEPTLPLAPLAASTIAPDDDWIDQDEQ